MLKEVAKRWQIGTIRFKIGSFFVAGVVCFLGFYVFAFLNLSGAIKDVIKGFNSSYFVRPNGDR